MAGNTRIGIDVGGTFTHAVAIDSDTLGIIAKAKVLTTHRAREGVARGIIDSLKLLLEKAKICPESVGFIAHSTTQATNALLEGDVAAVGVIGMGKGLDAWLARLATNVGQVELAPGKLLTTYHHFIDTSQQPSEEAFKKALEDLVAKGARAIAVSEAFSVDAPENEANALRVAKEIGLPATSGSEISQLYGLKARTRTAVINAAMLPKMMEAAEMTEKSVREAGIKAPIMIMRSDGGVMDIEAMRRRPLLTMLSGPAAGVAAAMMYLGVSDAVFMEVGGTSTDISAIRNGRAQVRAAAVGGHRIYMRTLDVHTVGVAGGSIPRLSGGRLTEVGPRSAHIAGLGYVSFAGAFADPKIRLLQPSPGDPENYVAIADGESAASACLTPTCAANLLGLVPDGDCASGDRDSLKAGFAALAKKTGRSSEELAEELLELAAGKCLPTIFQLMKDYKLDPELATLVGGGGGAAALVPFIAKKMSARHSLAENADVISAIGVALALVRETVERQIVHPDSDDILRIRQEAYTAVQSMGAAPETIEIQVEVEARTNIVRATASGATALAGANQRKHAPAPEEQKQLAADSMRVDVNSVKLIAETEHFQCWAAETSGKWLGGLLRTKYHSLRTLDRQGAIRLQTRNGIARPAGPDSVEKVIAELAEEHAQYGDAGRVLPDIMLLAGPRIVDLSGLVDVNQMIALAKIELETLPRDASVIVIASFA